jgi:hypothetical protein
MLRTIVNRALGARSSGMRGTTNPAGGGLGGTRRGAGAAGGRSAQDEAIGRGVRGLLRRFRV